MRGDVSTLDSIEFFQRDYSFRHEWPHFILKCAVDRTRLPRDVLQMQQFSRQNTLRKVGNPKVACWEMWRVGEQRLAVRVSACPRSGLRWARKRPRQARTVGRLAQSHRKPSLGSSGRPARILRASALWQLDRGRLNCAQAAGPQTQSSADDLIPGLRLSAATPSASPTRGVTLGAALL